jgi:hypothetical protein
VRRAAAHFNTTARPEVARAPAQRAAAPAPVSHPDQQVGPLAVNSWTSNGPAGGPAIFALAMDPTNSAIIYAASRTLVYKSTNGGGTWGAGTGVGVADYNGLAVARTNPNILYATGGGTVYKSTDAGATWNPTNLANNFGGIAFSRHGLAVDPTNANVVYVGTTRASDSACEVFKTTDGGATWVGTGLPVSSAIAIAINPQNPNVVYAGTFNGVTNGVWKTTAGGGNWQPTGPLGHQVWALAIDPGNPNTLYAGSSFDAANDSVWKSTNGGTSWTPINTGLTDPAPRAIAIDPSNPNTIYLSTVITAGSGVWRSTNGGASWSNFNINLPATTTATSLVVDPTGQFVHRGLTGVHDLTNGPPCQFSLTPGIQSFALGGGTGMVSVTASPGCLWTASTATSWITLVSGQTGTIGNGTLRYTVAADTDEEMRNGTITIAGLTFNVVQTGPPFTPPFIVGRLTDNNFNGLSNVRVTLSGAVTKATLTDAQGNYLFTQLPSGANANFTVTPASPYNNFSPAQTAVNALGSTPQVFNFAAVPGAIPTPTPALSDDFSGTTRNASKWNLGTLTQPVGAFDPQVAVTQNGRLMITPPAGLSGRHYNGYVSVNSFDFSNARASVEVPQAAAGGAETIFGLGSDSSNYFRFVVGPSSSPSFADSGSADSGEQPAPGNAPLDDVLVLVFQVRINGVATQQVIPYDPVAHRYWRFRHDVSASALVFETSADNTTFVERFRKTLDKLAPAALELSAGTAAPGSGGTAIFDNLSLIASTAQFSTVAATVGEGAGHVNITLTRAGNISAATATLTYVSEDDPAEVGCADTQTRPGTAFARCDYSTSVAEVIFAAGTTAKTVAVPVIDDVHVEGNETFRLVLRSANGASVGAPAIIVVTITDNDTPGRPNPVYEPNPANTARTIPFFVRQQYLDFLSREPEGNEPWSGVLNRCLTMTGGSPDNINNLDPNSPSAGCDRILVSQSFFGSPEFQLKGVYVFRFYKLAYNRLPEYQEIVADMSFVAGQTAQEVFDRKAQLATLFTQRPEFQAAIGTLPNPQYVAALLNRYQLTQITCPDPAQPDGAAKVTLTQTELVNRLNANTLTRAQVFRAVADSDQVSAFEVNNAFVAMQYYGYLRRKPEPDGFQAWLRVLQSGDIRAMVNGFLNSTEYRLRFGQP